MLLIEWWQGSVRVSRDDPETWIACLTLAENLLLHTKIGLSHASLQTLIDEYILMGVQVRADDEDYISIAVLSKAVPW